MIHPLVIPQIGKARFGEYLLNMDIGGHTTQPVEPGHEHFLFVLEGEISVELDGSK